MSFRLLRTDRPGRRAGTLWLLVDLVHAFPQVGGHLVHVPPPASRPADDGDPYKQLTQAAQICPDRIGLADLLMNLKQSVARLAPPRQHEALALPYIDGLDLTGSASRTATLIVSTDSPHQFSERPWSRL
ncbi:hypothetical protein NC239_36145 [Streptomyces sp. G3]|uniref:hypothetical protein n=1 Tax=unclassified Streptomyces TaxID=2593676 RepID=UPI002030D3A7|nr:hypothetical protein [Streptomyces sp. G3]MCM1943622.1 hypothetical protein [Streptomyces sp. G3]